MTPAHRDQDCFPVNSMKKVKKPVGYEYRTGLAQKIGGVCPAKCNCLRLKEYCQKVWFDFLDRSLRHSPKMTFLDVYQL